VKGTGDRKRKWKGRRRKWRGEGKVESDCGWTAGQTDRQTKNDSERGLYTHREKYRETDVKI